MFISNSKLASLTLGSGEHDPPGYRARRAEEKQEKLSRRKSLPLSPFQKDKPKRRSTRNSTNSRSLDDSVSRNNTLRNSATSRQSFNPTPILVDSNSRSNTPNVLHKAQSIRSSRSAPRQADPVDGVQVGDIVGAGQLGGNFPTATGQVVAKEKVGQDVIYYGGAPAARESEIGRRESVSTAGVPVSPEQPPLQWREREAESFQQQQLLAQPQQQSSRPSTRPGSMQPTYSYSGPSGRYPMQRGETGYE